MVEVIVEYEYTAKEPDELTIKKGDIIKDVIKKPGGWWEGTLNDKKGMFPDNFVRLIEKDSMVLRSKKDSSRIRQCRVVFSYNQDHEDELCLKVGDIINITGEEEEGWWRGSLYGKEGVFPSNFVEEILSRPKPSSRDDLAKLLDDVPSLPAKPAKQFCEVKYSYEAQNEDELNLKTGDVVVLLNKDGEDPGWWKGELNGKTGVFPDNFVVLLPTTDDKKPPKIENKPTERSAIKPSSIASQRKSLEVKNVTTKPEPPAPTKTIPPVPGKKPIITLKKSPSGSGAGLFSKLKDKIVDAVDGATGSKVKTEVGLPKVNHLAESANVFDQVDRRPLLSDVRANRARAPGRRLPTSIYKEDDEEVPGLPNGNVEQHQKDSSIKSEDSFKSEPSNSSENLDNSSSSEFDANEAKPKLREWEKHKAPWLAEMKLNQAKRTSVSPVPDAKPKVAPTTEPKPEPEASKSSQNSPSEKEVNLLDMSKSMSDIKISPVEPKPVPKQYKTPPNELDKAPPIKSTPTPPVPSRDSPSKSIISPPQSKVSPKPQLYENTTISKPPLTLNSSEKPEGTVSQKQFNEVLERLSKLEEKYEKQHQMIEDLRNRLQVETDMRMLLQQKITQNNVQV